MVDYYRQDLQNRPIDASGSAPVKQFFLRACWIGLGVLIVLAYVWFQGEGLKIGYRTAQLERANQELQAEVRALRVEFSALNDPEQIDAQARDLGYIRYDQGVRIMQGAEPLFEPGRVMMAESKPSEIAGGPVSGVGSVNP